MHEMLTIVRGVCLSVCLSRSLNRWRRVQCMPRAVCAGSLGAAFAKCLWPLVLRDVKGTYKLPKVTTQRSLAKTRTRNHSQ